jgi:hypothetical protein
MNVRQVIESVAVGGRTYSLGECIDGRTIYEIHIYKVAGETVIDCVDEAGYVLVRAQNHPFIATYVYEKIEEAAE